MGKGHIGWTKSNASVEKNRLYLISLWPSDILRHLKSSRSKHIFSKWSVSSSVKGRVKHAARHACIGFPQPLLWTLWNPSLICSRAMLEKDWSRLIQSTLSLAYLSIDTQAQTHSFYSEVPAIIKQLLGLLYNCLRLTGGLPSLWPRLAPNKR